MKIRQRKTLVVTKFKEKFDCRWCRSFFLVCSLFQFSGHIKRNLSQYPLRLIGYGFYLKLGCSFCGMNCIFMSTIGCCIKVCCILRFTECIINHLLQQSIRLTVFIGAKPFYSARSFVSHNSSSSTFHLTGNKYFTQSFWALEL
jgi:hypothetical protein